MTAKRKKSAQRRFARQVKKRPPLPKTRIRKGKIKEKSKAPARRKPRGFKAADPSKDVESMLERVRNQVTNEYGLDSDIRRSLNADFSIDWELRVSVGKRTNLNNLRIDIANWLRAIEGTWLAQGWRFQRDDRMTDAEAKDYERYGTGKQVHSHYQRMTARKIYSNSEGADLILNSMKSNRRLKPYQFFARIHWNLKGTRP